ncbi:MAG: protein-L-isoaspartate(D-aspartate) O-methyltransferase [Candidatus Bipolaricaulota bacterium]|nr:MAG: protein-L-isoaspartate(D-aspartate) O-methyltransferase [Candidatus Bipolaricaulota bacterium]
MQQEFTESPEDARRRDLMVQRQLRRRGIRDERVLEAMGRVPRHRFVPPERRFEAYDDFPLPIGGGQTISQPYIVALMTQALRLTGAERVLEIGTGSGYQTALLAELAREVTTIDRSRALSETAAARLRALGHETVTFHVGDGTLGVPESAPYDRVLATGSLPSIPDVLLAQLAPEGVLLAPVGGRWAQELIRVSFGPRGRTEDSLGGCRFVPLIGAHGWRD